MDFCYDSLFFSSMIVLMLNVLRHIGYDGKEESDDLREHGSEV